MKLSELIQKRDTILTMALYRTLKNHLANGPISTPEQCDAIAREAIAEGKQDWQDLVATKMTIEDIELHITELANDPTPNKVEDRYPGSNPPK